MTSLRYLAYVKKLSHCARLTISTHSERNDALETERFSSSRTSCSARFSIIGSYPLTDIVLNAWFHGFLRRACSTFVRRAIKDSVLRCELLALHTYEIKINYKVLCNVAPPDILTGSLGHAFRTQHRWKCRYIYYWNFVWAYFGVGE